MRIILAAVTALALFPAAAHAQDMWGAQDTWEGWEQEARDPGSPAPAAALRPARMPGPYASATLGYVFNDDSNVQQGRSIQRDDGWALRAALGHQYADFRAEAELGWQRAESQSGHVKAVTVMANAYYDLRTPTAFTPYVGAGLGAAWVDFDNVIAPVAGSINGNDWAFAWQLMAGVSYAIDPRMDIVGGYRYFDIGEAKVTSANLGGVDVDGLASHNIEIGLRYRF